MKNVNERRGHSTTLPKSALFALLVLFYAADLALSQSPPSGPAGGVLAGTAIAALSQWRHSAFYQRRVRFPRANYPNNCTRRQRYGDVLQRNRFRSIRRLFAHSSGYC